MAILRVAHRSRFTTISNFAITDPRISYRALGVLLFLLSKPDHWTCGATQLVVHHLEGREAILKAMRELEDTGYIRRTKDQDARGRWVNYLDVYEMPDSSTVGIPDSGLPNPEIQASVVKTEVVKTEEQRSLPSLRSARKPDLLFEAVCQACGINWEQLTPSLRGQLNKAVKEIRDVGATPYDVVHRAGVYRRRYRDAGCTPAALAKHWASLEDDQQSWGERQQLLELMEEARNGRIRGNKDPEQDAGDVPFWASDAPGDPADVGGTSSALERVDRLARYGPHLEDHG